MMMMILLMVSFSQDFNSSNYASGQRYSEFSYYDNYEVMSDDNQSYASMQSNLPFVTTQSEEIGGYKEPFIQYSPSDILCIVQVMMMVNDDDDSQ